MAFDAQTAWTRVGAFIASKPNHGRQDLLTEMARIAADCTIPEGEFQRLMRMAPGFMQALAEQEHALGASAAHDRPNGHRSSHAAPVTPTMAA